MAFLDFLGELVGEIVNDFTKSATKTGNRLYNGTDRQGEWETRRDNGLRARDEFNTKLKQWQESRKQEQEARKQRQAGQIEED